MILGINLLTLVISEIKEGEFFITFKIRKKKANGFHGLLVCVYCAAYKCKENGPYGPLCLDFVI
jgi:hypothetical protein